MPSVTQDIEAARRFYSRISRVYDALADADEHRARELGLQLLGPRDGERVLEIGFGTGAALVSLARAVGARGRVLGVDIAEGMREVAQRRLEQAGVSSLVEIRVAAIPPIPADDCMFDAAFMAFTLELFPDDAIPMVLRAVQRVLVRAGRLAVVAMDQGDDRHKEGLAGRTYRWLHHHFPHIVDCRPIDAAKRLSDAGFSVTRSETLEIWGLAVKVCLATNRME